MQAKKTFVPGGQLTRVPDRRKAWPTASTEAWRRRRSAGSSGIVGVVDRDLQRSRGLKRLAVVCAALLIAVVWALVRADRDASPSEAVGPVEARSTDGVASTAGGGRDAALPRAAVSSVAGDRAWTVFGIVRDGATQEPLVGAQVELRLVASRLSDAPEAVRPLGITETGSAGRYRLAVPELRALSASDLQRSVIEARATSPAHPRAFWEDGEAAQCPVGLQLDLETVAFAGLFGRVLDAAGRPVPEAVVLCAALDGAFDLTWIESEPDGRYWLELDTSAPHRCVLAADHAAFGHTELLQVTVVPRGARAAPDLVLGRATGVVAGEVRFADGTPVNAVPLRVTRVVSDEGGDEVDEGVAPASPLEELIAELGCADTGMVRTDTRGRFAFRSLRPGDYVLVSEPVEGDAGLEELFSPRTLPTGSADIVIEIRHARIRWNVRNHRGLPVFDAAINFEYWPPPHAPAAQRAFHADLPLPTDVRQSAGGGFVGARPNQLARTWVPWGSFAAIEVFDSEHAPHRQGLVAPHGAGDIAVDVRLVELRQPAHLRIRVVDADGNALPEFSWRVHRGDLHSAIVALAPGQSPHAWMPVPDGGRTPALPPGRLTLELRPGVDARAEQPFPYLTVHRELDLRPGTELPVEIRAHRSARVWLDVRRDDGPDGERLLEYRCAVRSEHATQPRVYQLRGEGEPIGGGLLPLRIRDPAALQILQSFAPGVYECTFEAWRPGRESYNCEPIRLRLVAGENRATVVLRQNQ